MGVSIIFGIIFIVVYYTAQSNLFKGTNRDWFKGIISWIAAALITYLGFAMLRFIGWEDKWKRRLEAAVQKKVGAGVGGLKKPARSKLRPGGGDTAWVGAHPRFSGGMAPGCGPVWSGRR